LARGLKNKQGWYSTQFAFQWRYTAREFLPADRTKDVTKQSEAR
jgi:hypothetical protein